jgi:hypothetical protein
LITTFILDIRLVQLIFTFEFIRRPIPSILSPSSRTFVELTLITYLAYMMNKTLPEDTVEERRIIRRSKAFVVLQGKLYKKSITGVLQRCVTPQEGQVILKDIHAEVCGHHASSRAIAAKAFCAGFYWLKAIEDAKVIVQRCEACQDSHPDHKHQQRNSNCRGPLHNGVWTW